MVSWILVHEILPLSLQCPVLENEWANLHRCINIQPNCSSRHQQKLPTRIRHTLQYYITPFISLDFYVAHILVTAWYCTIVLLSVVLKICTSDGSVLH